MQEIFLLHLAQFYDILNLYTMIHEMELNDCEQKSFQLPLSSVSSSIHLSHITSCLGMVSIFTLNIPNAFVSVKFDGEGIIACGLSETYDPIRIPWRKNI